MTFYREINVDTDPFDMGTDPNGRAQVGFNIRVVKAFSTTFAEEIVERLEDMGVGTFNTNIFISGKAQVPAEGGPYLLVRETGGTTPERTHNDVSVPAYPRPSAQLTVRADTYVAARTMARVAWNALAGVRNQDLAAS